MNLNSQYSYRIYSETMANYRPQKQTFCMHYKRGEAKKIIPLEHELMDDTGNSRSGVHKEAIKFYYNARQQSKLQMI
jgi:hypothetical protein